MENKYSIGCDVGGSHISCALVNIVSGNIKEDSLISIKVKNTESKEVLFNIWTEAILQCKAKLAKSDEFLGLGIAIPAPFDYEKGIGLFDNSNQKFVNLKHVNVKETLAKNLFIPEDNIKFLNDATAFSLGCYWFGLGKGSKKMVAITLGTGFGSSFISNGKAIVKGNTVPKDGCLWHFPYKNGIADDYFSTRWFVTNFNKNLEEQVTGVKRIADLARKGNKNALALFNEFGNNLADCLAEHLIQFNTEIVIMGGNIAESFELFRLSLEIGLKGKGIEIPFKVSKLKENAAMLGVSTI